MCNLRIEDFRPDVCLVELDQQAGTNLNLLGLGNERSGTALAMT